MDSKIVIRASWLGQLDYCEYRWFLENVKGVQVPKTFAMSKGILVHKKKEDAFKEIAVETTVDQFLKSKEYTITKEIQLRHEFEEFILVGKLDELGIDSTTFYVIDDKPKAFPWPGTKMQLWAYALLIENSFQEKRDSIRCILRDRDTNREVWDEPFTDDTRKTVYDALLRIKALYDQQTDPTSTENPNKCRSCVMHTNQKCERSVA